MKIRVLVVDDEALARERAIQLLKNDSEIEVIGQCGDGQTTVEKIQQDSTMGYAVKLDVKLIMKTTYRCQKCGHTWAVIAPET